MRVIYSYLPSYSSFLRCSWEKHNVIYIRLWFYCNFMVIGGSK